MRWVIAIVALAGWGRIGFDAPASGDGGNSDGAGDAPSDGAVIDAAPAFMPTQVSGFTTYSAAGAVTKLATDGSRLYLARSDLDAVLRYSPPSMSSSMFVVGVSQPGGLAVANGYLYISERGANRIVRANLTTGVPEPFAGSGASGSQDGLGLTASFNTPRGLATDGTYIYVADRGASCLVRRISIATSMVDTIAGTPGASNCALVDGSRQTARMIAPGGLVVVGNTLYVTDTPAIRAIDLATLEVTTLAGTEQTGFADATGSSARFSTSIAEIGQRNGTLYAADSYNYRVRSIEIGTRVVGTLAGDGTDNDNPGAIGTATVHEPDGLVFVGASLYVASDRSIHRID